MTLIWATKVKGKWTLVADSAVTIWQIMTNASEGFRPKIREIVGKNVTLIAAGCGTIKDIDFTLNVIENRLAKKKFKSKNELKFFIQETLADSFRELKTLTDSPQAAFVFLEPKTDTLWMCDEYSVTEPKECAQIAFGSADQNFYKAKKSQDFFTAFCHCVECDEFCNFPIIAYRDWEVHSFNGREGADSFYSILGWYNEPSELCCEPVTDPEWARKEYVCDWADKEL